MGPHGSRLVAVHVRVLAWWLRSGSEEGIATMETARRTPRKVRVGATAHGEVPGTRGCSCTCLASLGQKIRQALTAEKRSRVVDARDTAPRPVRSFVMLI